MRSPNAKTVHLEILRSIARRTAAATWMLRLWTLLVTGALLVVTRDPVHARFGWLAVFLAITFWVVDAHYLRQTRLFEKTYRRVQEMPETDVELLIDTRPVDAEDTRRSELMFSRAPLSFYGLVLCSIAGSMLLR
jgi:hypothetical protein